VEGPLLLREAAKFLSLLPSSRVQQGVPRRGWRVDWCLHAGSCANSGQSLDFTMPWVLVSHVWGVERSGSASGFFPSPVRAHNLVKSSERSGS
jgi:hypothetical protein